MTRITWLRVDWEIFGSKKSCTPMLNNGTIFLKRLIQNMIKAILDWQSANNINIKMNPIWLISCNFTQRQLNSIH